ncbi:MAG: polysaccharide deacetylase family protein [Armatimonadetes bacterium]|nr:polysaccharide deacetylase family protein [Armatimonadota bacterium]
MNNKYINKFYFYIVFNILFFIFLILSCQNIYFKIVYANETSSYKFFSFEKSLLAVHKKRNPANKYWERAKREVDKAVLEILAQHRFELERGIKYYKLIQGNPLKKQVALTFDDGPHPDYTPKLLEILNKYNLKATFFLTGKMAEKYPELVKAEIKAGHNVGNHTYHHVNLTKIPEEIIAIEIKACGDVLKDIIHQPPHLFRPPGGDYDDEVARTAEALGYIMVLWTDNSHDYTNPRGKNIKERVLNQIENGGIILFHDGVEQTLEILPQIIEYLKHKGYEFVTIDEMIKNK